MKRITVRIDEIRTIDLLEGKPIALKIPSGANILQFELDPLILRTCRTLDRSFGKKKA